MTNSKSKVDFFGDALRIFLDYIRRRAQRDPDYRPHPLIRAFECAIQGIEDAEVGKCVMGLSHEGCEESIATPYLVVLEKKEDGVEVKEIRELQVNREVPVDVMTTIFRLQIHLDRISGELVSPEQMAAALNSVIPGNRFIVLGHRWKEARDEFRRRFEQGKVHLPPDPELREAFLKITLDTPWEDYPNRVRALVGNFWGLSNDSPAGSVVITSPPGSQTEKFKAFEVATELLLGKTSQYLDARGSNDGTTENGVK